MPAELLASLPEAARGTACLCQGCVARFRRSRLWRPAAGPGDTYGDADGRMVFTGRYHLRRGYCCGNGCRHCPYDAEGRPRPDALAAAAAEAAEAEADPAPGVRPVSLAAPLARAVGRLGLVLLMTILSAGSGWASSGSEDFSSDPSERGWQVHGNGGLFRWDADRGALAVTWDSSQPNSFYHHALPRPVTRADDFSFAFTLRLDSHLVGSDPAKPGTFQIALGLIRVADATAPGFQRGVFLKSRNLVEWTWFGADAAISPSVSPVIVPADGRLPWAYRDSYVRLETGIDYRFDLAWSAAEETLRLAMTVDGEPGPGLQPVRLPAGFTDFSVDALAVSSYSDAGQDPRFAGSVLATGWIDDVAWTIPPDPVTDLTYSGNGSARAVTFRSVAGWEYVLEISTDLREWVGVSVPTPGTGDWLTLLDPRRVLLPEAFFRVRALRP